MISLFSEENEIEKMIASDFAVCLLRNGDLYLWGPTPVG